MQYIKNKEVGQALLESMKPITGEPELEEDSDFDEKEIAKLWEEKFGETIED